MATTTWNSVDLIGTFLRHLRKLGFHRVMVMDFASTDGTREVLTSSEHRSFVDLVPFPGIAGLDSSNVMLARARESEGGETWCLFCDPDELLVTPSMNILDLAATVRAGAESIVIPRFNMTAPRSIAALAEHRLEATDALTLRIAGRVRRQIDAALIADHLDPPWIYTDIHGKVLVRLDTALSIGEGDHGADSGHQVSGQAPAGTFLLHYPVRRYAAFREKVALARLGFLANPHLTPAHGWHARRWVRLLSAGQLHTEYLQQFVPDRFLAQLVGDGVLQIEESVAQFHAKSGAD